MCWQLCRPPPPFQLLPLAKDTPPRAALRLLLLQREAVACYVRDRPVRSGVGAPQRYGVDLVSLPIHLDGAFAEGAPEQRDDNMVAHRCAQRALDRVCLDERRAPPTGDASQLDFPVAAARGGSQRGAVEEEEGGGERERKRVRERELTSQIA